MHILKKSLFTLLLAGFGTVGAARVEAATAVGVVLGDPTGISLRFDQFPVLGISYSLDERFLVTMDGWIKQGTLKAPVDYYIGIGGKVGLRADRDDDDSFLVGARIPLGLQYFILPELEVFGELAPGIHLLPSTNPDIDLGIGIRYLF